MPAADHTHSPTPEEVMEFLDGESPAAARSAIAAHLAGCSTCQALAAHLQGVSEQVGTWRIESAPSALRAPAPPDRRAGFTLLHWPARVPRPAVVAIGAVAVLIVLVSMPFQQRKAIAPPAIVQTRGKAVDALGRVGGLADSAATRAAGNIQGQVSANAPARVMPESVAQSAVRAPAVIRTAMLRIVTRNFDAARSTVEAVVSSASGFIDQMTVSNESASTRALRGTLRVPADRLAATLARLREIGSVLEDTQESQDVTDQLIDLDARLTSARATEQRLTELLRTRTGRLSDVLDVERELTRVRLEIERLDAERTNVGRRVAYAAISIVISEERKAGLDGPLTLTTRLRIAAADGIAAALESFTGAILFVLRAGPALLLWAAIVGAGWFVIRRFRDSPKPRASE